jgi:peptidoglycan/LPS O-acetylase OafA/YrhL
LKVRHIKSLTGVRFLAALWVVLFHFKEEFLKNNASFVVALPILEKGHLAVPFFFILSGFILSLNYFGTYTGASHARFIWDRFARLWPVHAACVLLLVLYAAGVKLLNLRVNLEQYDYAQLPWELTMVRCWFSDAPLWNYPAWSIHAEWFAYLILFPLAFYVFKKPAALYLMGFLAIALLAIHGAFYELIWTAPGKLLSILLPFLAGSLLFAVAREYAAKMPAWTGDAAFVAILGLLFFQSRIVTALLFVAFGILILGLYRETGLVNRTLSTRVLVYGGIISYSLYMTHALIETAYNFAAPKLPAMGGTYGLFFSAGILATTLGCAALMYHLVEEPSNRWLRTAWRKE